MNNYIENGAGFRNRGRAKCKSKITQICRVKTNETKHKYNFLCNNQSVSHFLVKYKIRIPKKLNSESSTFHFFFLYCFFFVSLRRLIKAANFTVVIIFFNFFFTHYNATSTCVSITIQQHY